MLDFRTLFEVHVAAPRISGGHLYGRCPFHEDRKASFSANLETGLWKCHGECKASGNARQFAERLGLDPAAVLGGDVGRREIIATYDYTDERGQLLFQVVRFAPKDFRQRRPDGAGGWVWNLDGVRRVPYRLQELLAAVARGETVYVVEGEKDADRLVALGLAATTNPGGAGKWRAEYAEHFQGARVVILPDNDRPGREHVEEVARSIHGVAAEVKVVSLPGLPAKGDVSDWLAAGHTAEELRSLADEARRWTPPPRGDGPGLLGAAEILAAADAEGPDWLVDGLLPVAGMSLSVARPKTGKSTLARALAVAVCQGRPFLGRGVRQGPVLLISLEDRLRDVARHLRRLGLRPEDPLLVASEKTDLRQVRSWVEEHRPVLVVVDTIGRLVRMREVSEYGQVLEALDGLLALARQSGAHLHLLHHSPKGGDGRDPVDAPLGSTAFAGTADVVLHLKRAQGGTRTIASVQRVGEDLPESVLILGEDGCPDLTGTKREYQVRQVAEEIVTFLAGCDEPQTTRNVLDALEGRTELKLAGLDLLVAEGRVRREGTGRRGDPYRFLLGDSFPRFPDSPGKRGNEMEKSPNPASMADEFVSRDSGLSPLNGPVAGNESEPNPEVVRAATKRAGLLPRPATLGVVAVSTLSGREEAGDGPLAAPEVLARGAGRGASLLRMGETLGWEPYRHAPGRSIAAGKAAWVAFVRSAPEAEFTAAVEAMLVDPELNRGASGDA